MNRQLAITNGRITGYYCQTYNYYNDILNSTCKYCNEPRPSSLDNYSVTIRLERLGLFIDDKGKDMSNEEREWFIKLFSNEKVLVKDLDNLGLRDRKAELINVIRNGKVRLSAIEEEERERDAKLTKEQRSWKVSDKTTNPNVSDALAAVKERKARMSKADRLAASLGSLGLDSDEVSNLMRKVEQKQTSQSVNTSTSRILITKPTRTDGMADEDKPKLNINLNFLKK